MISLLTGFFSPHQSILSVFPLLSVSVSLLACDAVNQSGLFGFEERFFIFDSVLQGGLNVDLFFF